MRQIKPKSNQYVIVSLFAAVVILLSAAACDSVVYPEPTESYSVVGGFELTATVDEPGPHSIGIAEYDYWYPYSMDIDQSGNLLVTNIRGAFLERFELHEDGGAEWTAYWAWGRGRDEHCYPLFVTNYGPDPDIVVVSESYSLDTGGQFPEGASAYYLLLPAPELPITPGRPGWNNIYTSQPPFKHGYQEWENPVLQQYSNMYQPGDVTTEPVPGTMIVVSDTSSGMLRLFNSLGTLLAEGGGMGDQEGVFRLPLGIDYGPDQMLAVADTWNHRVQLFEIIDTPTDEDHPDYVPGYDKQKLFAYRRTIGGFGAHNGGLSAPYGVCFDTTGNVYVADTRNARVQKYDGEGNLLAVIYGEGEWRLRMPLDVAVDDNGDLLVLDAFIWYEPWERDFEPDEGARIIRFRRD